MEKKLLKGFLLSIFLSVSTALLSQNVGINTTGATPSANAILDLNTGNAKNLGIIIPRVVLGSSLTTFSPPMANTPTGLDSGMMVYNWQATNQPIGYYCWNGSTWINVSGQGLSWNVSGNAGTIPGTNYAGTADAKDFIIKTNANERMRFLATGKAGIGTATPQSAVDINGNMSIGAYAGANAAPANGVIISGNVGIATAIPGQALEIGLTTNTIRVDGLKSGSTYNIVNGSAPLTAYMMYANTNGDLNAMAAGATGNALIWTATGPQWGNPVTSATAWQIVGNSNITDGTNFLGTTNTVPINFQINGSTAGRIDMNRFNTFLGYQTTPITTTGQNNAALGYSALKSNTTASFNTAVGAGSLAANNAANNTAVGYDALTVNTGTGNTGIGYEPLFKATTGTFNTAIGYLPLGNGITTGSFNAAMGYEALFGNTSGADNIGIGYEALFTNTTASNNTGIGYEALEASNGTGNTGIGYEPLLRATSGGENFAGGYLAMANGVVTGSFNTALGYEPLYNATTGGENTAIGYLPMAGGITSGVFNNAIGGYPLYLTTSGGYNNALGYEAGYEITTTSYNNTIGYLAGFDNTGTANNNLGYYAGYENIGSENNAIGYEAGYEITGFYNNAFGYFTGSDEITGSENNAIGYYAGYLTEGNVNNVIGMYAGYENYGYSYNNEIGYYAGEITEGNYNNIMGYEAAINCYGNENNLLGYFAGYYNSGAYNNALGAFALYGDLNFGTGSYNNAFGYQAMYSNGAAAYDNAVGYQAMYNITSGTGNSAIGDSALRSATTGSGNIAIGSEALFTNTTGSFNTALGYKANVSLATATNATAIGSGAVATASNQMVLGSKAVTQTEFSGALMPYYGAAYNAGTAGQVLTSQGASAAPQWASPAAAISGANNGLAVNSGTVQLGGSLVQNTSVTASSGNYNMNYDLGTGAVAGTGAFNVTNGGSSNPYLSVVNSGNSSNTGQVGIGTSAPNISAALDISSNKGGMLFPRMDSAHVFAIPTPSNGLVVFNTSSNCLQLYAGMWVNIVCGCTPLPAPGAISGTTQYCAAASGQTYTCGTVAGAVGYIWSMSPNIVGSSIVGSGTTATVNFAATPATYTISVADSNATHCISGYTSYIVAVGATPAAPATPSGNIAPVISTAYTYTVTAVAGQTYTWSSSNTNVGVVTGTSVIGAVATATVTFSASPGTTNICVFTTNNGCNSPSSCLSVTSTSCIHGSITFNYTGGAQTWAVPACISQVTVTLAGASGGAGGNATRWDSGGYGGTVAGVLLVTGGTTLDVYVGGMGGDEIYNIAGGTGGFNGGGTGGDETSWLGGGGGGATDIRVSPYALANRVVVAGAGGGGGDNTNTALQEDGGVGGGLIGGAGSYSGVVNSNTSYCGQGGTQLAGGAASTFCSGSASGLDIGGNSCATYSGGGGGSGYYGGGNGSFAGGGGGSSYVGGLSSITTNTQGTNTGAGYVTIQY